MAPVILAFKENPEFDVKVLATAQHRQLLDQVLDIFGIQPDIDLDIMQPNQSLTTLTGRLLVELDDVFSRERPDAVLAQGDTTTVMAVAMTCFYHKVPFGHVEAGLRTWDMKNPFPEEMNRVIAGKFATWHFAPTENSRNNLLKEGFSADSIYVTGNTVIDALHSVAGRGDSFPLAIDPGKRLILVTSHRRENFGEPFENICRAILRIVAENDVVVLYPVHPNPNVRETAHRLLGDHERIILCDPLDYLPFVSAMKQSTLILSDSGGVQEEAPALGKPVLVLREETERPEAVVEGVVKLVGTNVEKIVDEVNRLLADQEYYMSMAKGASPYGDGKSAARIFNIISDYVKTSC